MIEMSRTKLKKPELTTPQRLTKIEATLHECFLILVQLVELTGHDVMEGKHGNPVVIKKEPEQPRIVVPGGRVQ